MSKSISLASAALVLCSGLAFVPAAQAAEGAMMHKDAMMHKTGMKKPMKHKDHMMSPDKTKSDEAAPAQ